MRREIIITAIIIGIMAIVGFTTKVVVDNTGNNTEEVSQTSVSTSETDALTEKSEKNGEKGNSEAGKTQEQGEEPLKTEEQGGEVIDEVVILPEGQGNDIPPDHVHKFVFFEKKEPSCSAEGYTMDKCSCGAISKKTISKSAHRKGNATCTEPAYCLDCGAYVSAPLGHTTDSGVCSRCGLNFQKRARVSGLPLDLGDSMDEVKKAFGNPAETLTEGGVVDFVYYPNTDKLTIVQFYNNTVAAIYTFDMSSKIKIGNIEYNANSNLPRLGEQEKDTGGLQNTLYAKGAIIDNYCTITVFLDNTRPQAMWIRLKDFDYNFQTNSTLYSNFYGQKRLSFHIMNTFRVLNGVKPLIFSDPASDVAYDYSLYLTNHEFKHDDSYGQRLTDKGIRWATAGENISAGYENCFYIMCEYYNSISHRQNIIYSDFTHVGVGFYRTSWAVYGAQEFFSYQ